VPFQQRFQLGGTFTRARGINDFGITAGFIGNADGTISGFVGSDSWGYEIVQPPGSDGPGSSSLCTGINNLGQVACTVNAADGITTWLYIGSPSFW
jgi:hypothetical protein